MVNIPTSEITFHPLSYGDHNGRLFSWNGQLYRSVTVGRASLYQDLFNRQILQNLVDKKLLVETQLTSFEMDGSMLVLKHRTIPFTSYPNEWSAAMLKDAALLVINLVSELSRYGMTLQDGHPWNVLFDGTRPVYVDIGSIVLAQSGTLWPGYDEFCRFFLNPLQLISQGQGRIARWLIYDQIGIRQANHRPSILATAGKSALLLARQFVPERFHPSLRKLLGKAKLHSTRMYAPPSTNLAFLEQLRRKIESIPIAESKTEWTEYYDGCSLPLSPSAEWTRKQTSAFQVLTKIKPRSVLDIGSNRGWFSQLAAYSGSLVVAFDTDESCITSLYRNAKANELYILPLLMDFTCPSPGYGVVNQLSSPATERLRCDLVLALALVHHLVFKKYMNFEQIASALDTFSSRWLLVEFVPREDKYVREWWSERYSWYQLDNFIGALKKHYREVSILPSDPDPRVLLLCEK
jgi:SAM-dependent methyltransferase